MLWLVLMLAAMFGLGVWMGALMMLRQAWRDLPKPREHFRGPF